MAICSGNKHRAVWGNPCGVCILTRGEDLKTLAFFMRRCGKFALFLSAADRQREIVCYTRVHVCYLIFYGPHAFDHADSVRIGLFRGAVRAALKDKNLYPVPGVGAPVRAPELFNSEWWERADLTVTLYEYVRREYDEAHYETVEVKAPTCDTP